MIPTRQQLMNWFPTWIGFDELFGDVARVYGGKEPAPKYPPYNISTTKEGNARIEMAVAGFAPEDIHVKQNGDYLEILANHNDSEGTDGREYYHRGLASRIFARKFKLANDWEVDKVDLTNGILTIDLWRKNHKPEEQMFPIGYRSERPKQLLVESAPADTNKQDTNAQPDP